MMAHNYQSIFALTMNKTDFFAHTQQDLPPSGIVPGIENHEDKCTPNFGLKHYYIIFVNQYSRYLYMLVLPSVVDDGERLNAVQVSKVVQVGKIRRLCTSF